MVWKKGNAASTLIYEIDLEPLLRAHMESTSMDCWIMRNDSYYYGALGDQRMRDVMQEYAEAHGYIAEFGRRTGGYNYLALIRQEPADQGPEAGKPHA